MNFSSSICEGCFAPAYELVPENLSYPFYFIARSQVVPGIPDKYLSLIVPFAVYWIVSLFFHIADISGSKYFEPYRIHESQEITKRNRVTVKTVILAVLVQQAIQTGLGLAVMEEDEPRDYVAELRTYGAWVAWLSHAALGARLGSRLLGLCGKELTEWTYWWGVPIVQSLWASFILDTWQYFWHRAFHMNKFLYRHIHSHHHRLYVPYAFGALYNHPLEGFLLDSCGTEVAHILSGMSMRQAMLLFGFSTWKTVDDHCGFALPWDPLQFMFGNNADYHDIHHQNFGLKKNFSQPYYTNWDIILGTRMLRSECPKKGPHTDGRDPAVKENAKQDGKEIREEMKQERLKAE